MYRRMNNICIIHGNNICRNDVFERRKKIRKYNSLVTCLHNIFQISEFSFPYDKQNLRNEEAKEKHEKEIYLLSSKSDWKRNGNRPIRIDNRRFPSKHPSPQHTKVQYKVSPFAEVGQFPRPHDHRVAWSLGNVGSTSIYSTAGIRENRLRHGVPPGDCESRSSCSTRGLETRSFRDARRIVRIIHAARGVYVHTRGFQCFAPRDGAVGGESGERRKRKREKFLALELN